MDHGERPPVPHVPDPAREKRVPGMGRRAPGRAEAPAGAVPRVTPPSHGRSPSGPLRCMAAACGSRGDGVTWQASATGLEDRRVELQGRVHRGSYRAPLARRVSIPTPDGRQRPVGIAALEDTMVPPAVVTLLTQMDEEECSGLLLWGPARTQSAPGVGRALGRPDAEAGERRAGL